MYLVLQVKRWQRDLSRYIFGGSVFQHESETCLVFNFPFFLLCSWNSSCIDTAIRNSKYMEGTGLQGVHQFNGKL